RSATCPHRSPPGRRTQPLPATAKKCLQRCLCGRTLAVMPAVPDPSAPSAPQSPAPADEVTPSPTALRALAHPLRLRMLGLLRGDCPSTASRLAAQLGLNAGATSLHQLQLVEHGFVGDDPGHGNARERWWRAAHRTTHVPDDYSGEPQAGDARQAFS